MIERNGERSVAEEAEQLAEDLGAREAELERLEAELDRLEERLGPGAVAAGQEEEDEPMFEKPPARPVAAPDPTPDAAGGTPTGSPSSPPSAASEADLAAEEPAAAPESVAAPAPAPPAATATESSPQLAELLRQHAGIVQRVDHLRVCVENLDRKLEGLAAETLEWMGRRDRGDLRSDGPTRMRTRRDLMRLAFMAAALAALMLLWFLIERR